MGQQGSKNKKGSGGKPSKGLLGDLADAAEGATSSITKAIEDTSHQVTSTIENTTKSVTEAIDKTAKNVSGTVDSTVSDVNKKAEEAGKAADDAATNLRGQADEARKNAEGQAKGFKDAADSKARELEEAAKALEDAANAKAKEMQQTADSKKKELEDAAKGLEAAAESKAKELESSALAKKKELEDAANAKKKEFEDAANAKAKEAEEKAKQLRDAAEAKAKEVEAAAVAKKKEMEAKAAELERAAAARKKQLEEAAAAKIREAQKAADDAAAAADAKAKEMEQAAAAKAKELEDAVAEAAQAAEAKKKEMEQAAADKAKELEDAVAEAAKEAEAKKKEMESAAASKAQELQSAVQGQANSARDSIQGKVSNAQSQAAGARGALDSTVSNIRGSAEQSIADVKSQGQAAVDEAKQAAEKIQDDINRTLNDANQALTDAQKQAQDTKAGLSNLAGNTAGLLKGTAETLTDTMKTTATTVVDQAVTFAADTAKKSVQQVSGTVGKAAEDVTKGVTGAVHNVSNTAVGAAGSLAAGLLGKAGDLTGALAQGASNISGMTKQMGGHAEERKADLDDIADSLIQDTSEATKKTASNVDDIAGNLMKGAASIPKKVKEVIKDEVMEVVKEFDPSNAVAVCSENDLKDGEMKVFQVGEGSVLLCKENGSFSAIGTKCSHYGAPLVKGVLSNGKVRCPWHGACFNTSTGDIEDSPGLDSVSCYRVKVENGQVLVSATPDELKNNTRTKNLAKRKSADSRTFVIIGGGGAGESCAETLRQEGFSGRIVVLSKESDLPYDRPKLSKALSSTGKDLALRNSDYYKNGDIEMMLNHEVTSVDVNGKTVTCKNGTKISYTSLMIATGGRPVTLNKPGNDLDNICYLRTPGDANKIAEAAKDKNAVVVGTSFIGMEVAAYLHGKAKSITVIGRSPTPFANIFGPEVGERLKKLYVEKEIKFHFETEVEEFIGDGGKLTAVKLKNGETVDADICVIGIGVRPATEFLNKSGILMNENGYIPVDETLKTSSDGVFAGGDIVEFPLCTYDDEFVSIGHWQMAQTHGRVAGRSMLGKGKPLHTVPFFWASMFGKSLRYAGCNLEVDDYVIDGDLEGMKFVCYACAGDKVVAVAAMGMDPVASQYASYVSKGKVLKKSDIKSNPQGWLAEMTC